MLKNKIFLFITTAFVLTPFFVFAQTQNIKCSPVGYTIATINGVFTSLEGAVENSSALQRKLLPTHNNEPVVVDYLLNPSHIAGIGDAFKVMYQKVFEEETVEDYDLVEMLRSASEKVKTKKVLLVAHSQGNFYANSFHDKVFGQPGNASASSIAVYSIATPASRVAGGGKWLTSSTDKVISDFVGSVPFKKIMPANTKIILKDGDDELGHNFSDVYIKYRSAQIVSDIKSSLDNLKANNSDENLPCIAPPKLTVAHKVEGAVFAVVDPVAQTTKDGALATAGGVYSAGTAVVGATKNISLAIGSAVRSATSIVLGNSNSGAAVVLATETNDTKNQEQTATQTNTINTTEEAPVALVSINQNTQFGDDALQNEIQAENESTEPAVAPVVNNEASITKPSVNNIPEPKINFGSGFSPGFGGGSAPVVAQVTRTDSHVEIQSEVAVVNEPTPPLPVLISITSPGDFSRAFSTTTIIFSGTSTPGSVISNSHSGATTTASEAGDWSLSISSLNQGVNTIQFFSSVLGNANVGQQEIILTVDVPVVIPPSITSHNFPLQLRTKTITFSGTSTPGFVIKNNFNNLSAIASSTKAWSLSFSDLPEGTTTIKFFATNQDGVESTEREAIFNVYTIEPMATNVGVAECAYSMQSSPQSCFIPEGKATISWSVNTPNYSYFEIIKGTNLTGFSTIATTSETTAVIPTTSGEGDLKPYELKIVAVSIFGNRDLSTNTNKTYFTASHMPVIINEVAWAGNTSSPYAEWIELKNRTVYNLNLSGLYISAEDGTPHISLSGVIPANGYFLVGRGTSDNIFGDVVVDLSIPFSGISGGSGLSNGGEVLRLNFGGGISTSTVDETPALSMCDGWCGGSGSPDYKTMERKHADVFGGDKNNWGTNDGSYLAGHDKEGNVINGTPKVRNSVSMGKVGFYCDPYTASFIEGGYYVPARSGVVADYYNCRFLTDSLTGHKVAGLYRGVVGSSTRIYSLLMGTNSEYGQLFRINQSNFVQGENYFSAIYESPLKTGGLFNTVEMNDFENFFTGISTTTPPHQRYGILNWTYGVAP